MCLTLNRNTHTEITVRSHQIHLRAVAQWFTGSAVPSPACAVSISKCLWATTEPQIVLQKRSHEVYVLHATSLFTKRHFSPAISHKAHLSFSFTVFLIEKSRFNCDQVQTAHVPGHTPAIQPLVLHCVPDKLILHPLSSR